MATDAYAKGYQAGYGSVSRSQHASRLYNPYACRADLGNLMAWNHGYDEGVRDRRENHPARF